MYQRKPRESDDDSCFPQPEADAWNTPMWRYMDLWKFELLLANGLYFSRLDELGDSREGTMPAGTVANLEIIADIPELRPYSREVKGSWKHHYDSVLKETFAMCWQLSNVELWWMWKAYCVTDTAVAIRTTYAKLDECLPPCYTDGPSRLPLLIGKVQYGSYDSLDYSTPLGQRLGLAMSKRDCFQDEREVRVLFDYGAAGREKRGVSITDIDLNRLVTSIVISPVAPETFRDEIDAKVRAAGYLIPVQHSPIRNQPRVAFK